MSRRKKKVHCLLEELKRFDLVCATVNGVDLKTGFNEDDLKYFCEFSTLMLSCFWHGTAWLKNGDFARIREINGGYWWDITKVPPIPKRLK